MLNSNYQLRKNAQLVLKKLKIEEPNRLIIPLITTLTATFESLNLFDSNDLIKDEPSDASSDQSARWPSSKGLCEFVLCVTYFQNLTADSTLRTIVLNCSNLANTPLARQFDPRLLEKFLKKLLETNFQNNKSLSDLFKLVNSDFIENITNSTSLTQVSIE